MRAVDRPTGPPRWSAAPRHGARSARTGGRAASPPSAGAARPRSAPRAKCGGFSGEFGEGAGPFREGAFAATARKAPPEAEPLPLLAVPYHAWANRQDGAMRVWIPALRPQEQGR
ncbi:hypothetical protein [Streptomyces sp. NPDC050560]|uniref:hypothetical protein n=1 Tax=Streptomyces sp. NPDC050560 TaxID=3365630 RepID=UPI0037B2841E